MRYYQPCPTRWRSRFNPFWHRCTLPAWHGTPHRSRFGFALSNLWRSR